MIAQKITSRKYSALITCIFILALTFSHLRGTPAYAAGIRYAIPGGTGDCSNWANACSLQTALTGASSGDEVWAAAGTHIPTDRYATFRLNAGVALYGGFAGSETSLDQRDPKTHVTILSGDVDHNDSQTPIITDLATVTGNTTNSYHVVTAETATGAIMDGFTITAGYANQSSDITNGRNGGGMLIKNSSSPTVTNTTFSGNLATSKGGGVYTYSHSNPSLTNVTFNGNSGSIGGGMSNDVSSSPSLTNIAFISNSATVIGGGLANHSSSSPTLMNVTFSENSTGNGGGMYNSYSSPALTNVTFSHNSAYMGGGMYNYNSSSPRLTNVTLIANTASFGGGIYNTSVSNPQIRNSIFWENTASQIVNTALSSAVLSYNVVQDGCPAGSTCTSTFTGDPLVGLLGNYGGFAQTFSLLPGSSAIDTGNDATCAATDQRGITRPQGAGCDIGAYEAEWEQVLYTVFLTLLVK